MAALPDNLLTQAATRYRQREQITGGVVIFNAGIPTGWMDRLRDPRTWQPGINAIDEHGNRWIAWGGDPENGAEFWHRSKS